MERRLLLTDKDIQEGEKPKVIFDAHGSCADSLFPTERENDWRKLRGDVIHYEPHEAAHNVRELVDVPKIANLLTEGEEALKQRLSALVESALIRILIIDERIDPTLDNANVDFSPELSIKMRDFLQGKNIYVNGREYAGENIPDKNSLIDWVKRREVDIVFLHQGIVDKLHKKHQEQGERQSKNEYAKKLLDQLKKEGKLWDIVIHSARGGIPELPRDVKFLSLSSIDSWIARTYSKHDIIQELLGLRRTEGYEAHYTHK
jgi:vacuolar-type H+-ATPase subunit F/Vma7